MTKRRKRKKSRKKNPSTGAVVGGIAAAAALLGGTVWFMRSRDDEEAPKPPPMLEDMEVDCVVLDGILIYEQHTSTARSAALELLEEEHPDAPMILVGVRAKNKTEREATLDAVCEAMETLPLPIPEGMDTLVVNVMMAGSFKPDEVPDTVLAKVVGYYIGTDEVFYGPEVTENLDGLRNLVQIASAEAVIGSLDDQDDEPPDVPDLPTVDPPPVPKPTPTPPPIVPPNQTPIVPQPDQQPPLVPQPAGPQSSPNETGPFGGVPVPPLQPGVSTKPATFQPPKLPGTEVP